MKKILLLVSFVLLMYIDIEYAFAEPTTDSTGKWEYNEFENGDVSIHSYIGVEGLVETDLTIPSQIDGKNVTSIEDGAFISGTNLIQISIPAQINNIEEGAFFGCISLKNFVVSSRNPNYVSSNGILMNKDKSRIISYPSSRVGTYTVPKTVTYIAKKSFAYSRLSTVNISEQVEYIGDYAFMYCVNLRYIEIPSKVNVINEGAFACCNSLKYVKIRSGVENIGEYAFLCDEGLSKLKGIIIPSSVESIGEFAFENCDELIIYGKNDSYGKEYADYKGISFKVTKLLANNISMSADSYIYDSKYKKPDIAVEFSGYKLVKNEDYQVTYSDNRNPGKATVTIRGMGDFTGTIKKNYIIKPSKATGLKQNANAYSDTSIDMSFDKVVGVDGYEVYRSLKKNGSYTLVTSVTSTGYKNQKLSSGKDYYYKVRGYKLVDGNRVYGEYSDTVKMITKTKAPNIKVSTKGRKATITLKKITGAKGYEIYMKKGAKGKYKKIKTLSSNKIKYTKSKLSKGSKYYFRVRSYRVVNGRNVYSKWSKVVGKKIK